MSNEETDKKPCFEDIMRDARIWHFAEVRAIANDAIRCLIEAAGKKDMDDNDRREWMQTYLHNVIDGHDHVIYNGHAYMVLLASDNEEAWRDVYDGESAPDASGRAYHALMADVEQLVCAREDEWIMGSTR